MGFKEFNTMISTDGDDHNQHYNWRASIVRVQKIKYQIVVGTTNYYAYTLEVPLGKDLLCRAMKSLQYDHSESFLVRKCTVWPCAPLRLLSREMQPRGGARIFSICTVIHFQTYWREDLGYEPTPEYICGLVMSNEPKHNVWLKTF